MAKPAKRQIGALSKPAPGRQRDRIYLMEGFTLERVATALATLVISNAMESSRDATRKKS